MHRLREACGAVGSDLGLPQVFYSVIISAKELVIIIFFLGSRNLNIMLDLG